MSGKRTSGLVVNPTIIDERYRVEKTLGRGGMAVVYQVFDTVTEQTVALKLLLPEHDRRKLAEITNLFEHEYQTLVQLAHPGVITVYNYGKSDTGPYYTMELLDGGDLHELAPLGWKETCSLLLEVCSALGLLHSRRQVHRDLSPRNIRCTKNLKAKLMDFGAMTPMGPCKGVIGTPAFTAPEVVGYQPLDARTDLYSLGATFYYTLTGSAPYPARNLKDLRNFWQLVPPAPSERVASIPKELDDLVMSLINVDPMTRPVNAVEVMERLSAIAGLEIDDRLIVSKSYLSTPTLVGRDKQLLRVQKSIDNAVTGKGATVVVEGDSGVGRSRFLDALLLQGRLTGAAIVKIDAADARAGAWSGLRYLAFQLLDALPDLAAKSARKHTEVLSRLFPEVEIRVNEIALRSIRDRDGQIQADDSRGEIISYGRTAEIWGRRYSSRPPEPRSRSSAPAQSASGAQELRQQVHQAMSDWLFEVSRQRCVIVAVDDLDRIDEPSAAFIALISQNISDKKLLLAVTLGSEIDSKADSAVKLLKDTGKNLKLKDLNLRQTEQLCGSMFGETANRRLVADRLYSISKGNPRTIMLLAQHLLDKGLIRYQSGSWLLPDSISAEDLPNSLNDALKARIAELSGEALDLARTMALRSRHSFAYQECQALTEHKNTARLIQNLDELVAAEVLTTDGEYYAFSQQGWIPVLTEELDQENSRDYHLRLAEVFERRQTEPFRTAQHYLEAGREQQALDILIRFSQETKEMTSKDPELYTELRASLPRDWFSTMSRAIDLAKQSGRPKREIYILQSRLTGLVGTIGTGDTRYLTELLEQLYQDSGLGFYRELGDSVPAQERFGRAFKMAQERFDALPDSERILAPSDAIRALATTLIEAIGYIYITDNLAFCRTLPSIKPLTALSPALWIVEKLIQGQLKGMAGRIEEHYRDDREIVQRLDQPDKAGLEGAHYLYMRYGVLHALAIMEAMMGLKEALDRTPEIETSSILQVNAWRIRKLYFLWQGEAEEAENCQKQVELLQIQNSPSRSYEGTHLTPELRAYSLSDDLLGVKRIINDIKSIAERFPSYRSVLHFAQGEYHRIRGDSSRALDELNKALELGPVGESQNWAFAASAYLRTLLAMKREEQARIDGEAFLADAQNANLGYLCSYIRMPLALSQAKLGDRENAVKNAEAAIADFKALGTSGINLGLAYETRARVAMQMNDEESFTRNVERCAEHYRVGRNPALTAKYQVLKFKALRKQADLAESALSRSEDGELSEMTLLSQVSGILDSSIDSRERGSRLLELLVARCRAMGGFLYTVKNRAPVLVAQSGNFSLTAEIDEMVRARFYDEVASTTEVGTQQEQSVSTSTNLTEITSTDSVKHHSVILGHYTQEGFAVTGIAVLLFDPSNRYDYPANFVTAISKVLADTGDTSLIYAAS
ncbi:MAG: protein kinase [Deltaproteobacteria bacterium]|nr:protein kinase [Deltaproteobacteria bacterium]